MPSGLHLPKLIAKAATNNAKKEELTVTKLVTQIQVKLNYTVPAILMANTRNIKVSRKTGIDGRQYVTLLSGQVKVYALGAWRTLTYDYRSTSFLYRGQYVSWQTADTITRLCAEHPNDYAAVEWVE